MKTWDRDILCLPQTIQNKSKGGNLSYPRGKYRSTQLWANRESTSYIRNDRWKCSKWNMVRLQGANGTRSKLSISIFAVNRLWFKLTHSPVPKLILQVDSTAGGTSWRTKGDDIYSGSCRFKNSQQMTRQCESEVLVCDISIDILCGGIKVYSGTPVMWTSWYHRLVLTI